MSIVHRLFQQRCEIDIKYETNRTKHKTHFKLGLGVHVPRYGLGILNFGSIRSHR